MTDTETNQRIQNIDSRLNSVELNAHQNQLATNENLLQLTLRVTEIAQRLETNNKQTETICNFVNGMQGIAKFGKWLSYGLGTLAATIALIRADIQAIIGMFR